MINNTDLHQALHKHAKNALPGIQFVPNGQEYTPNPSIEYVEGKVLNGVTNITIDPNGADTANGIYQLLVHTPLQGASFYRNSEICDIIRAAFPKGYQAAIEKDGQRVTINNVDVSQLMKDDTHQMRAVSVYYRVIGL